MQVSVGSGGASWNSQSNGMLSRQVFQMVSSPVPPYALFYDSQGSCGSGIQSVGLGSSFSASIVLNADSSFTFGEPGVCMLYMKLNSMINQGEDDGLLYLEYYSSMV